MSSYPQQHSQQAYYPQPFDTTGAPWQHQALPTIDGNTSSVTYEHVPGPLPGLPPSQGPPLPPRPHGSASRLSAASNLNFPPPPRSPNRPPTLPPRPQGQPYSTSQYQYSQIQSQPYLSPPSQHVYVYNGTHAHGVVDPNHAHPQYTGNYNHSSQPQSQYGQQYTQYDYPPPPPGPPPCQSPVSKFQTGATSGHLASTPTFQTPTTAPAYSQLQSNQAAVENVSTPLQVTATSAPTHNALLSATHQAPMQSPPVEKGDISQMLQAMHISQVQPALKTPSSEPVELSCDRMEHGHIQTQPGPQPLPSTPQPESDATISGPLQLPDFSRNEGTSDQLSSISCSKRSPRNERLHRSEVDKGKTNEDHGEANHAPSVLHGDTKVVTSCLDTPVKFSTTWYYHKQSPDISICSRCYTDHILHSPFQHNFVPAIYTDDKFRRCRFDVPTIKEKLLPIAFATRSFQPVLQFMKSRLSIPDCSGIEGVQGSAGIKWYKARNSAVEGMVVCEACYEDMVSRSTLVHNFEPAPGQPETDTWNCDLAVPFIHDHFLKCCKTNDWQQFCEETKSRLVIPGCPGTMPTALDSRKWFIPANGPHDISLCTACYCDFILTSGQEAFWVHDMNKMAVPPSCLANCCMGNFAIKTAVLAAVEKKDWSHFWHALATMAYREPFCNATGTKGASWYTFPSQPPGFGVCGACHAAVIQSLGIESFFVPVDLPPGPEESFLCCMNQKHPRFLNYASLMVETWSTRDNQSWLDYVEKYGGLPRCPRDNDFQDRFWYGWKECVICPECYVDFVRGTALDSSTMMPLRGVRLADNNICEMYSPRMRKLFLEACDQTPPNTSDLLQYSLQRRLTYWKTMPHVRRLLAEQMFEASMANANYMHGMISTGSGYMQGLFKDDDVTYGEVGVGFGFETEAELEGAKYHKRGDELSMRVGDGNRIMLIGRLEAHWKSIE